MGVSGLGETKGAPLDGMPPGAERCPGCQRWVYRIRTSNSSGPRKYLWWIGDVLTAQGEGDLRFVTPTPAFAPHRCRLLETHHQREARREEQEREKAARIQRGYPPPISAKEWREKDAEEAQQFACPKCEAPEGEPCANLRERAKGKDVAARWPHPERNRLLWDKQAADAFEERERQRLASITTAETFICPKCEAQVGQRCVDLAEKRLGSLRHTNWPHAERQVLAEASQEGTTHSPSPE